VAVPVVPAGPDELTHPNPAKVRPVRTSGAAKKPKVPAKRPVGRPPKYSARLAARVCKAIGTHALGLEALRQMFKWFPSKTCIYQWRWDFPEFAEMYVRAREAQAQILADELQELADTPRMGQRVEIVREGDVETSRRTVVEDMVAHRRLQIDTRKFIAVKLLPRFADTTRLQGPQGGAVEVVIRSAIDG
jgi:plasmid stabilization system protein ParE